MPTWGYVADLIRKELEREAYPPCNCEKCMPWLYRSHTIGTKEKVIEPNMKNRFLDKTRRFLDHE
jgi:hypothetical protein